MLDLNYLSDLSQQQIPSDLLVQDEKKYYWSPHVTDTDSDKITSQTSSCQSPIVIVNNTPWLRFLMDDPTVNPITVNYFLHLVSVNFG